MKKIRVNILVDTREKQLDYIMHNKLYDEDYKNGIKIEDFKIKTLKTGDISIEYSIDDSAFKECDFCIEVKKGADLIQTLCSDYARFERELDRAKNLNFYVVHDWNSKECEKHFEYLKKKSNIRMEEVFIKNYIELCKNVPVIQNHDLSWVVRKLIKKYIKENVLKK